MNRRYVVSRGLVFAALAFGSSVPILAAPVDLDQPGAEAQREEPDLSTLQPLLPPFTSSVIELDPDAEGWGPLQLSPSGRFLFVEVAVGERQSVHLFDAEGKLIRDLTREQATFASAAWGANDQQLLLEYRDRVGSRPRYLTCNPVTGITTNSSRGGLPEWALGGKDYLQALATAERAPNRPEGVTGFQRYTSTHDPIGRPLAAEEPAWSGDGQWLAFLTEPAVGGEPGLAASLHEVRVLPARGEVPRVVMSRGGWERLIKEQGWQQASGPDALFWAPTGDALYCLCTARAELDGQRFLVRLDIRTPRREVLPVPAGTEIVSASADARHWLVRLGARLYRLDFKVPPAKKRAVSTTTAAR